MRLWKIVAGCLGVIFLIFSCSAIIISEVELNPPGKDTGNEWIEFYSESLVSLEGYKMINKDGGQINLFGNFSGFFVYDFGSQWLDNGDEKVSLWKGGEVIDETEIIDDSKNDDFSWVYCSGWKFKEGSRGKDNNCEGVEEKEEIRLGEVEEVVEIIEEEVVDEEISVEESEEIITGKTIKEEEIVENNSEKVIYLNSKDIKSQEDIDVLFKSKEEIIKNYAIYVFVFLCVIVIVLLLIDRR